MMTTHDRLRHHIVTHFMPGEDPASLGDQTPLITGGILDSIRTLKLMAWIEDEFGVMLDVGTAAEAMGRMDTIAGIAGMIDGHQSEGKTP